MTNIQLIFPILVVLVLVLKLYLNNRQAQSINSHFNNVPNKFAETISLDTHQKSGNYTIAKLKLSNISIIINSIILIILTTGGFIQYLDTFIGNRIVDTPITHGVVLIITISIINMVFELPLNLYATFNIEERFGFNRMTIGLFIRDTIKSLILSAIIGIPLLYLILWLMSVMGNLWWFWVWCALSVFSILIMLIYPTFIAPLFNKFTPLEDESLRTRIYDLLNKCGFKSSGIFVMDGSKRSSHGNAYFTGIGKSKRIVFFDTLLKHLTHEEIEAILAHELGHFKRKHIIKQIGLSFIINLIAFYILGLLINQPDFYHALGVNNITNYNALILFIFALGIVVFPFSPITSYLSRKNEFEADDFAKQYSNKDALISGLVKLYKENASTLTPDDIYAKFYYSHPPASIRIAHLEKDT
ncbi:MAG: M48 family metallopeptidase [Neisseriaceae bacterium]